MSFNKFILLLGLLLDETYHGIKINWKSKLQHSGSKKIFSRQKNLWKQTFWRLYPKLHENIVIDAMLSRFYSTDFAVDFTFRKYRLTFFPKGLSNAHILHKLFKKTFEAFCINVFFTKFENMQDKKRAVVLYRLFQARKPVYYSAISPHTVSKLSMLLYSTYNYIWSKEYWTFSFAW